MTHIPYRGATPAYLALIRGEIAVMIGNLGSALSQRETLESLRLSVPIAPNSVLIFLPSRNPAYPAFPRERGGACSVPHSVRTSRLQNQNKCVARALDSPALRTLYTTNTMEREDMTPEQFTQFIRDDTTNWARQIKAAGINPN
jgi:tripartite-type tricarboxylate transporter receptor subunit TctC